MRVCEHGFNGLQGSLAVSEETLSPISDSVDKGHCVSLICTIWMRSSRHRPCVETSCNITKSGAHAIIRRLVW